MKRVAFTIVFNGLHHLQHLNMAARMIDMFDYWVIAEGASAGQGKADWYRTMPEALHNNGRSVDGTAAYCRQLERLYPNKVRIVLSNGIWSSKDAMVQEALRMIPSELYETEPVYLFQVDVDEQWTAEDLDTACADMDRTGADVMGFDCRCWFGPNLVCDNVLNAPGWIRLWRWQGQPVLSHAPPAFIGLCADPVKSSAVFDHYAYRFLQDVEFKSQWYRDHECVLANWRRLNSLGPELFPVPLMEFFEHENGRNLNAVIRHI